MQDGADLRVNRQSMRFRNRMRHRNELDLERPEIDAAAGRHHGDRYLRWIAFGGAFGLEQRGAELGRIDRAFQPRPKVDNGAEMIFMGMRQNETDQILPLLLKKADIGHDGIYPRQMLLVAEGNAEIDHEPGALMPFAKTIDRQVHADFADTAKRCECQLIRSRHQAAPAEAAEPK